MKSLKQVFRMEAIQQGDFVSLTHYNPEFNRLYKGRRINYYVVHYVEGIFLQLYTTLSLACFCSKDIKISESVFNVWNTHAYFCFYFIKDKRDLLNEE